MKTEDVTRDGYYWVWIGSEAHGGWHVVRRYSGSWPRDPGGSFDGLTAVGPIEPPRGTPAQMAQWDAERKERQYWGIPE